MSCPRPGSSARDGTTAPNSNSPASASRPEINVRSAPLGGSGLRLAERGMAAAATLLAHRFECGRNCLLVAALQSGIEGLSPFMRRVRGLLEPVPFGPDIRLRIG